MAKKITNEMIKQRLYDRVGDEYTLMSDYTRGSEKVELLHSGCGETFKMTPNHFFYDNNRCPCLRNTKRPEDFAKEFSALADGEYIQLSDYVRSFKKISILHVECDRVFEMDAHSFLAGRRCSLCYGKRTKTTAEFKKEVHDLSNGEFSLVSEYVNNRVKVTVHHRLCGKDYLVVPKDYLRGNRCPFCKQSKGERTIRGILDRLNVTYEIEKSYSELMARGKYLPFDFFLPDHNLLIEYDGEQHFKEVAYFGGAKKLASQQRRDARKNAYAEENNIRLLRIPYTYSESKIEEVIHCYL